MATQDTPAGAEGADALIMHTADIVVSYVANNSIGAGQIPLLIQNIHETLQGLGRNNKVQPRPDPAVSVRSSVKKDHIICLEDGKKMKMLKRHLRTEHGLTPAEYRARWNLPNDYPMVASDYADKRRDLALKIGLGRTQGQKRGWKAKTKS
jgi:predicted transcriptional regulator